MKNLKQKPSVCLTQIRNFLKKVVFNPRKPGPMQIISDVGSAEYYELRAIEEIHAARSIRQDMETGSNGSYENDTYIDHIVKAIQLLILSRLNV